MSSSPVKFQALWRGYSIRAKMHRNGVIATMIQSSWRGYSIRAKMHRIATMIQSSWRGYSIRAKMHRNGVIAMIGVFATMIQSTWRGYSWRKNNVPLFPVLNGRQVVMRWQRGNTLRPKCLLK